MSTEAKRRANAKYAKAKAEAGRKVVALRLDADVRAKLEELAASLGSKEAAAAAAIMAYRGAPANPEQTPKPQKAKEKSASEPVPVKSAANPAGDLVPFAGNVTRPIYQKGSKK